MKQQIQYIRLIAGIIAVGTIFSCTSSKKTSADALSPQQDIDSAQAVIVTDTFVLPDIPATLTHPDVRAAYLVMHYWDRFDFADRELVQRPEITEQAFVNYINILGYVSPEKTGESLAYALQKAAADTTVYVHFASLFEKYLYESNSPFHNEELYLPALRLLAPSPLLRPEEKARYAFQLDMALKNRVGDKAADFPYTLPSGKSENLHSLKSEYLLLIFSDPACETCVETSSRIAASQSVNDAFSINTPSRTLLTILTVYPGTDKQLWRDHLSGMPSGWLHAYDKDMRVQQQRLYDLKAMPAIYLLDTDKRVLLKDASVEEIGRFFSKPR